MNIRLFLILLSISLSGCSLIYSYSDDLSQRIDKWTDEKKYNVALDTISYIKPSHKYYRIIQRKKNEILKLVAVYENTAIESSSQLAEHGNWLKAFNLLDEVAENIPDTSKIEKHHAKLLLKRNKLIKSYENDILSSQAVYLAKKMVLYEKINKMVRKNETNELDIEKFDRSRHETSLRLTKRGELQFKKKEYDNALTTIDLALKLKPDEDIVLHLNIIKKSITKATKLKKSTYVKEIKTLISKLSQGYSHAILKETKEKIIWLDKIKGNEKVYLKLIDILKKHLAAGTKQRFAAARKLYSKGKTQDALSIWLELKKLDPEYPKLQSHISRAEKVLNKLKILSNKPEHK